MKTLLSKPLRTTFAALTALLLFTAGAHAITIVDYDFTGTVPDEQGNSQIVDGRSGNGISYSLDDPLISSSDYPFSAPANNATVYGGLKNEQLRQSNGTPDFMRTSQVGAQDAEYHFALVWKKADFLNGFDSATANITSESEFNMNLRLTNTSDPAPDYGWIIIKDGTTYVSQLSTVDQGETLYLYGQNTDLTSLNWYEADFATDMENSGTGGTAVDTSSIGLFSDIDGAGVYLTTQNSPNTGTSAAGFEFNSFSATVIPEPSAGLLLVAGVSVFLLRRRRRG